MKITKIIFNKWFIINILLAVLLFIAAIFATNKYLLSTTRHGETIEVTDLKGYTLEEVEITLSKQGLRYEILDYSAYTPKYEGETVVKQQPKAGHNVKEGRVIYLTINPDGYSMVDIPNLIGKTQRQASSYLKSSGFKLGRLEFRKDIGKNVVLDLKNKGEILEKDAKLVRHSTIDLVLGSGLTTAKTKLPKLIGLNLNESKTELRELSLNIGNIKYDGKKLDDVRYFIYKQQPAYNEKIIMKYGSRVSLWLTSDSTKLPKLTEEIDSLSVD